MDGSASATRPQGEFSHVWTYGRDGHSVRYAMDFPFVGWHQLTLCYQGQGWDVLSETAAQDRMGNEYVHAVLSRPTGECAVLCFSLHRADGSTLAPQFRRISFREKLRTNPVVSRILGQEHVDPDRCTAQFQQLMVTPALPGPDELMEARRLFERARLNWLEAGLLPGQQPRPQGGAQSAGLATGGHRP
jgi:hypothetical protein